jgi:hypothetical protein
MGRPKKSAESLENEFWDVFARWDLAEQKVILRVMTRLVLEREKDEMRAPNGAAPGRPE